MKLTRILGPIIAALLVVGAVAGFFWWQIRQGADLARRAGQSQGTGAIPSPVGGEVGDAPIDTSDRALVYLRQGDVAALQGSWAEAEAAYAESVRSGGGVVALRKLAQVQLQRRKMDAVRATIERLRQAGARGDDLLLLRTIVLLRTGDQAGAETLLAESPDTPQKHYGLALLAIVRGNHEETKTHLQLVIGGWDPILRTYAQTIQGAYDEFAQFPEGQEIHLDTLLARALAEVQECEIALPLLSRALGAQEDYRDAWIVQGYCELATERYAQARASLERAYSLDPEKPEIQFFLGKAYAALGDHRNALKFFQYALKNGLEPAKDVRRLIAAEAVELGEPTTALEQYRTLMLEPDADSDAFVQYVSFALTLGQTQDAEDAALKATKKWPENAALHELLGSAALALGKKEEARAAFEKALLLDPTRESSRELLKKLQ